MPSLTSALQRYDAWVGHHHDSRRMMAREPGPISPRPPRLLDEVRRAIRTLHYSRRTEEAYVGSTQNQALSAILFLYQHVLERDLEWLDGIVRAKAPRRLPVVLTRDEVRAILDHLDGAPRLVATLLYGSGIRLLEGLQLRIKDVDFGRGEIVVRSGKGGHDRRTVLPSGMKGALCRHLE